MIPLLTPVIFHETVPLKGDLIWTDVKLHPLNIQRIMPLNGQGHKVRMAG